MSSRSSGRAVRIGCACVDVAVVAALLGCATRQERAGHAEIAQAAPVVGARDHAAPASPVVGARDHAAPASPVSLDGWPTETFALPPAFAPELPGGTETLLFSPGWRDPSAEGFWSYAFVMWIEEAAPGAERLEALLESYYNGLLGAFAAGSGRAVGSMPARVQVVAVAPHRYEGRMHAIDAFATFEPIELRILIEATAGQAGHSLLTIRVSPRPEGHPIWRSLEAAIASILSREGASPANKGDPGE